MSTSGNKRPETTPQMRAEIVGQLCHQLPLSLGASLVMSAFLVAIFWTTGPRALLLGWFALQVLVSVWRITLYANHRRMLKSQNPGTLVLYRALNMGSLTGGVLWGFTSVLFYPAGNLPLELFHTLLLAGVTAGATTSLASDRRSAVLFQVAVLIPLAIRLLQFPDVIHQAMAAMVLLYGTYVIASTNRVHMQITENIALRIAAVERERALHDSENRYRQLAHHDALTGLLNRHSLQARLPALLEHAARTATRVALIYLDIDNFKDINDARGHGFGDQLLVAVANRLRQCAGADDLIVRMGGDEFIVVTPHASDRDTVELLAQQIKAGVGEPLPLGGESMSVRISIGIGIYPDDGVDAEVLMKYADIALYQAKARGRNNYQFFAADMSHNFQERIFLEQALAKAVGTDQLFVQYQPLVDLASSRIIGLEALVRWRHPERGLVSPAAFIPIAEHSGLINVIGEHVLRAVCAQLKTWQTDMVPLVPVAVNVSPRQFEQGSLVEQLAKITAEYGIEPSLLQIEITETALMKHIEGHGNTLQTLRDIGVRVSIDDFGTGYSSLSYLKHLPIDCLKIDRSFVHDMVSDTRDAAIVSAVVGIARSLGIRVVAEGVESAQQVEHLRALGCDAAQGYLFHRPMSADRCRALLEQLARQPATSETLRLRVLRWVGADGRSAGG